MCSFALLGSLVAPADAASTGTATTRLAGAVVAAVEIQADDKVVVAATSNKGFAVLRYNRAGKLDTTWGSKGVATTNFTKNSATAAAVAIQAEGRVVVAGSSAGDFVLARYTTAGKLDTSFGGSGTVRIPIGSASAVGIALQADGKIVVVGNTDSDIVLATYAPNGKPASRFGTNGVVRTDLGGTETANAIALRADGRIVITGQTQKAGGAHQFALLQYTTSGTLDSRFATAGKLISATPSSGTVLALDSSGRAVIAYSHNGSFASSRYSATGKLDTAYGTNGIVTTTVTGNATAVAVQADGRTVVAGTSGTGLALTRLTTSGRIDTTYGRNGATTATYGKGTHSVVGVVLNKAAQAFVAGSAGEFVAVAKFAANGKAAENYGS
ncbi:NHL repeat-containing protein [Allokutzneria albata]|uniref:hypothetical protein n=1 Tax=Allokutzneria albata TaxID=211114 RepID=UPI000A8F164B|nr:hypothetical protein [Allokutzneria albata]